MTSINLNTTGLISKLSNGKAARNNGVTRTTPEHAPNSANFGTRELGSETHSYRTEDGASQPGDVASTDEDGQGTLGYFEDFSGVTTLHGLRYIGDQTSVIPRRLLWLALLLVCATLFGLQVRDRADYFWSSPVSVNFKVNYNTSLAFPAVTLCNQNSFRLTAAYKSGWLAFIEGLYGDDPDQLRKANKLLRQRPNAKVNKLFQTLAHRKEDLIVRCRWGTGECSAANFTTTLTSHGVCFTFNKVDRPQDSLTVEASGAEHGLRLTLNTEHYEHTKGPHDTTGIKMLVTDQSAAPMVEEIGLAISAGTHAFVGIKVMALNNQPPPHGVCGEVPLVSTDHYSQESCMMECRTRHAYTTCGCRHFYMPDLTGKMPICSITQFVRCLRDALDSFNKVRHRVCVCPSPCFYHIYEPSVSYAASSQIKYDIDENKFRDRLFAAKQVLSQTDVEQKKNPFDEDVLVLSIGINDLIYKMFDKYAYYIREYTEVLDKLGDDIVEAIEAQDAVFDIQMFVVRNDLFRARDEMEEATFRFVCQDYHGLIRDVQDTVTHLVANTQHSATVAKAMYLLLGSSLDVTKETVERALDNYTHIVNAYRQGELILNDSHLHYDWSDIAEAIPRTWLNDSTETVLERQDFLNILESVRSINAYVKDIFENKTISADTNHIHTLCSNYQHSCETYMPKKISFYSDFLERPEEILKQRIETFNALKTKYAAIRKGLSDNMIFLNASLEDALYDVVPTMKASVAYVLDYVQGNLPGVTKFDVASKLSEVNTISIIKRFEQFVGQSDNRADRIHDTWSMMESGLLELWTFIYNDAELNNYERLFMSNETLDWRKADIQWWIGYYVRDLADIRYAVRSYDYWVMSAVEDMLNELEQYSASHSIDEAFYRRNFMEVDVYFKELRTEQIIQQVAYDEIALLCDIGGSTGLFIGGSMMTVFEFVEFLFICLMCRVCSKKTKTGTTK